MIKGSVPANVVRWLGILLIGLAIILNEWVIEFIFVADGELDSTLYLNLIRGLQLILFVSGGFLVWRRPALRLPRRNELLLFVFGVALPLFSLEIGIRFWLNNIATEEQFGRFALYSDIDPDDYQWSPHHYLNHYPTPNYRRGLTFHNSLGFRGQEFSKPKPAGVFRIVAVGGSTTYTVRVEDNNKTFTAQLEKILREEYGYEQVEVINAGVADYNSWETLINLEFRVLDLDPDLVVVYQGTNDVHARLVSPDAYRGDNSGRRKKWEPPTTAWWEGSALLRLVLRSLDWSEQVSLSDFVAADTYLGWPNRLDGSGDGIDPDFLLDQNPPTFFARNLRNMTAIAAANEVDIMFATWAHSPNLNDYAATDYYQRGFREGNEVMQRIALEVGVPLFDFAAMMPQESRYWADGRHVNEEGALEKASLFAVFIDNEGLIPDFSS